MARIQLGGIITSISGSIGGFTFQRNRSGNIVRLRGGTFKASTIKQTQSQSNHTTLIAQWQGLSLAEKDLWNIFALTYTKIDKFGNTKTLTGINWFMSINANRVCFGYSILLTPPIYALPVAPGVYDFTASASTLIVDFNPVFSPVGTGIKIWTTPPLTTITSSLQSQYRLTSCIESSSYDVLDITADWVTTHNIPYPPSSQTYCFTIGVLIQTCLISNGICSAGLSNISATGLPITGIGFWIIGDTFSPT
jgi:hypothetical protein